MATAQSFVVNWLEFMLATTLVLLVAAGVLRRVRQPADRINIILIAFGASLIVPMAFGLVSLPEWRLGVFRPELLTSDASNTQSTTDNIPSATDITDAPVLTAAVPENAFHQPSSHGTAVQKSAPTTLASRPFTAWHAGAVLIVLAHLAAGLFFLLEWCVGTRRLLHLVASASAPADDVLEAWKVVTRGSRSAARLLISDEIETPIAFGLFRPVVLVPRKLAGNDIRPLRFCLAHEWAHLSRGDLLAWWFSHLCQFVMWPQPLYWRLRRELRICQDILADDGATSAGRDSVEYSELLLGLAKQHMARPVAGAIAFVDGSSQISRRIRTMLSPTMVLRSRSRRAFCCAAALVGLCCAGLFSGIRLVAAQPTESDSKATVTGTDTGPANGGGTQEAKSEKPKAPPADKPKEPAPELRYTAWVLDKETKKGLEGARVTVRRSKLTSEENTIIEETSHSTDAEGKYSFVIPSEQVAVPALYIELDVEHDNYAAKKGFGYALSMIRKNEPLGEAPFFEKTELTAADPVKGTIHGPEGKPLAHVMVKGFSMTNRNDFNSTSWCETVTDESGRFSLNFAKGGTGVMWVIPRDYAGTSRAVNQERGGIGIITLKPGVRTSGRILTADGQPAPGVPVEIHYQGGGNETDNNLPVATSIRRSAISDAEGRFQFGPLPNGTYRVAPSEYHWDDLSKDRKRNRERHELPGVFMPVKVTILEGTPTPPIEIQATPHVLLNAQIYDSAGKKSRGHSFHIVGRMDGQFWSGEGRPNSEGTVSVRIPHGLEKTTLQITSNEHGATRFRRGPGKELENNAYQVELGTVNDDINGFEIIKYKAPIVLVKAVDDAGAVIKGIKVAGAYSWGKQRYVIEGETRSDLSFERQDDGRMRTSQMLPDEDVKFTISAKGYESATETMRLPEGETKELVVTLKKAAEKPVEPEKPAAAKEESAK